MLTYLGKFGLDQSMCIEEAFNLICEKTCQGLITLGCKGKADELHEMAVPVPHFPLDTVVEKSASCCLR